MGWGWSDKKEPYVAKYSSNSPYCMNTLLLNFVINLYIQLINVLYISYNKILTFPTLGWLRRMSYLPLPIDGGTSKISWHKSMCLENIKMRVPVWNNR